MVLSVEGAAVRAAGARLGAAAGRSEHLSGFSHKKRATQGQDAEKLLQAREIPRGQAPEYSVALQRGKSVNQASRQGP